MDRKIQPEIQTLKNFRILPPVRMTLPNGIPLTVINAGEQEVVRIDVLFAGARWQQSQKLQALFTNRMLREGTTKYTAATIAEKLDYYGSWLELSSSSEYAEGAMPRTNDIAWPDGFVTAYAMNQANEDFVENIAMYVTHTQTYWDNMLRAAGETGAATINKKFAIVYNYLRDTWGIDLNELRKIVLRRQQEITEIDLSTIQ